MPSLPQSVINSKTTLSEWGAIERPLNDNALQVNKAIIGFATSLVSNGRAGNGAVQSKPLCVFGDSLYNTLRVKLEAARLVSPVAPVATKHGKPPKPVKESKKFIIQKASALSKATLIMDDCLDDLKNGGFVPNRSMTSTVLEVRGIGFIHMLLFICSHAEYLNGCLYVKALSLIVTVHHFLESLQNYNGQNMIDPIQPMVISGQMMTDLRDTLKLAERKFPFDGLTIYKHAPELTVYSQFHQYIPTKSIAPRVHQAEIIQHVADAMNTGGLFIYKVMIGGGKTASFVGIAELIRYLRKTAPAVHGSTLVLFCCSNAAVKNEVGKLAYNSGFPFAMGSKVDEVIRITNNFNCKNDSDRLVIISGPDAGKEILNQRKAQGLKTVLFLDEPTTDADDIKAKELKSNVSIMKVLPFLTILASATMPDSEGMKPIVDIYKINYPGAVFKEVSDPSFAIPSDIQTFDGHSVVPYLGCECRSELEAAITVLENNKFLRRSLTANGALDLIMRCSKQNVPNLPDITQEFKSATSINTGNVLKFFINTLKVLSVQPDAVIAAVCAEVKQASQPPLDLTTIGTTGIIEFPHLTLIAHPTPDAAALEMFGPLLRDISSYGVSDATELLREYDKVQNERKIKMEKKQRSDSRKNARKTDDDVKGSEPDGIELPDFKFPARFQIGTLEHVRAYATSLGKFPCRNLVVLENLPLAELNVPDIYLTLLMCGVGIYHPESKILSAEYNSYVLEMAANGKLTFLIANRQAAYGTNFAIYKVIITEEYARERSLNSIFQLMGRTGRVNQSWKAKVIIGNELKDRLLASVKKPETIEAENIAAMVRMLE